MDQLGQLRKTGGSTGRSNPDCYRDKVVCFRYTMEPKNRWWALADSNRRLKFRKFL